MSETCKKTYSDMIEESQVLPENVSVAPLNTVSHDMVSVKVCKREEIVDKKCENTSLGVIEEMVDKQRYNCLADNCKFETKLANNYRKTKFEQEPKKNIATLACLICMQSFRIL